MKHDDDSFSGPFSPAERDQLEQELLELHFGCHEHPERLQARLAAEPALQDLQREVLRKARLLEEVARPSQPPLDLPLPAPRAPRWRMLRSPVGRLLTAAGLAAATVLGFFVAERATQSRLRAHQQEHLHLTVSAPKAVPAGAPWSFTVQAQDLTGAPADCRVKWQAFGERDAVLAAGEAPLTAGAATVAMPADLRVPQRIEVVAANASDEVRQLLTLSTAAAGPLVHVTTDRPVYRPNETVFVRTVVLDRVTLLPLPNPPAMDVRLLDAKGAPVGATQETAAANGVGGFAFAIPPESSGGPHRVEVSSLGGTFPRESVEIVVRSFQAPQLKKTIVLDRVTYAPGARGSALVQVERMGGGPAAGAVARTALVLDGTEVWTEQAPLDGEGRARFRFAVPKDVREGAARFVATITDGGLVETELKPFVVPTGKVLVAGFPEGGELVAGVENGLYLECSDPLGRPVDTAGEVVDDRGEQVAKFRTAHQGRVKVAFVPRESCTYTVRLAGQPEPYALPAVKKEGIALRLPGDEIGPGAPVKLQVAGRGDGPWLLGVFCRGVLVGQTALRPDDRGELRIEATVELPATAAGVLRATVFDRNLQPVAERLLRRAPSRRVAVELRAAHAAVTPGDNQQITVRTTDEQGRPVAAAVGLSVTDLAAVSLGSEPRIGLADHVGLFADVERTENLGDFLPASADAARNADLLLGTRGWRRFVWRNDDVARAAIAAKGHDVATVLAREGFSQTPQVASNKHAAEAPGAALRSDAWRAERRLGDAARCALLVLALLLIGEGFAFGARRLLRWRGPAQFVTALAGNAVLLFVVISAALGSQSRFEAVGAAPPAQDFAADIGRVVRHNEPVFAARPAEQDPAAVELMEEVAAELLEKAERREGAEPRAGFVMALVRDEGEAKEARKWAGDDQDDFFLNRRVRRFVESRAREYAHKRVAHEGRSDFAPTILWNALLTTGPGGEATVSFATSDAVTTWLVQADAHDAAGRVGQAEARFQARLPFHLEAKLPDELSAGDRLLLPIAAIVEGQDLREVALTATLGDGLRLAGQSPNSIALQGGRGRALLPIAVDAPLAQALLTVEGKAGTFTDLVKHTLRVAPRGFPHQRSAGGTVAAGSPATFVIAIPADAVPGSGRVVLELFPSALAALTEGLRGILREPCGCFEQASSSNYPNTLVLTLLEASGDDVPVIAARARELLPRGYAKITGYECKERGYEWFGGDPGHEALTAYGLLQFHDMAKVHDVDAGMVDRTKAWLLARRDGSGGYRRSDRALDSFGRAPQNVTDAYVTYALLQAGVPAAELRSEIAALVGRLATKDPYELAVIACALHLAQRPEAAGARESLGALQQADGSLCSTTTSITSSGGRDLAVETTGFAVLAWLPDPAHQGRVRAAVEFLQRCRGGSGTFGATQATIQALRALTAYAAANRSMREPGTLRVREGERLLAERAFAAGDVDAITIDLWAQLAPGEHTLQLELQGGGQALPWACEVQYHAEQPADDPATKVAIRTSLRSASVAEGDTVALDVAVENRTAEGLPMTMAIVGLPAGLDLPTRVLEDLQKASAFAFWELRGRELALYWRDLAPEATRHVTLDLVARMPGTSLGPASRTYLYYTPAQKRWAAPLAIEVTAQ